MPSKFLLFLLTLLLFRADIFGQNNTRPKISVEKNAASDTIWLSVNYSANEKPGSLMFIASAETLNITDTFFLPVIDTFSNFGLAVPPQFRTGNIRIKGYYYPKIFSINGKLKGKKKTESLLCLLITNNQKIYNQVIPIADDNTFKLPGLIFEKNATLVFNNISKKKEKPDVEIEQIPQADKFIDEVYSGQLDLTPDSIKALNDSLLKVRNIPQQLVFSNDKVKLLENVTVKGIKKSNAQKYNELYSTGFFNDNSEKLIDCLDNDNILSYPDCLSFLRSRVAGLMVSTSRFGENIIKWRGKETNAFYIDEIPVDIDQIINMNLADIAIIKIYPPPFFGSLGNGDGGAIAVYTRTGDFIRSGYVPNKWLFIVKGYTPALHTLFEKKN